MSKRKTILLACLLGGAAGCGYNPDPAPMPPMQLMGESHAVADIRTAADYREVTQQIYIAYFGRPADPGGLDWFTTLLLQAHAPTDIAGLSAAYWNNPGVREVVDTFATSKESADLYPGDAGQFLDAVYKYVLNRAPDTEGKKYWLDAINSGALNRAVAAISIMAGARGSDVDIVNNKTRVAVNFTNAADTALERLGYAGLDANVVVRSMLGNVTAATDPAAFQPTAEATLASLATGAGASVNARVMDIIGSHCVSCHSSPPPVPGAPINALASYDTPALIKAGAARIYQAVVVDKTMPTAGSTSLTDDERAAIAQWYNLGTP